MIHCDDVFDILTRGPFPTGAASDAVVEGHLIRCGQCRQLADALRPAVELFQEAVAPEESHGLPSYWGQSFEDAEPWSTDEFEESAEPLPPARRGPVCTKPARRPGASLAPVLPWAAAVLVGIALTSVLTSGLPPSDSPHDDRPDATLAVYGQTSEADRSTTKATWRLRQSPSRWIAEHKLRPECYDGAGQFHGQFHTIVADSKTGSGSTAVRLACCKGCHADGDGVQGRVAANDLVSTCAACHQM